MNGSAGLWSGRRRWASRISIVVQHVEVAGVDAAVRLYYQLGCAVPHTAALHRLAQKAGRQVLKVADVDETAQKAGFIPRIKKVCQKPPVARWGEGAWAAAPGGAKGVQTGDVLLIKKSLGHKKGEQFLCPAGRGLRDHGENVAGDVPPLQQPGAASTTSKVP